MQSLLSVGGLYTVVPDHRAQITLITRQRGWSMGSLGTADALRFRSDGAVGASRAPCGVRSRHACAGIVRFTALRAYEALGA